MNDINTKEYWDKRFSTGDWEAKKGRSQTYNFARSQVPYFEISPDLNSSILDFGCGLGDAFPIYHESFPLAKLIGIDISEKAIELCRIHYREIAEFICGDYKFVPEVDIIIASNVFEHLTNDIQIAKHLINLCKQLIIVVPYNETIKSGNEHVNTYNEYSFKEVGNYKHIIFPCVGWSQYGPNLLYQVHFKNIFRKLLGIPNVRRDLQIMYKFTTKNKW